MPQAVENREKLEMPEAARSLLSRLSGGAAPIAIREGVAVFDQLVEIDGEKRNLEIAMREVQIRSGSAREETIERDGKQVTQRLCDVIWTTGATVRRYDWWNDENYDESLEVSESAIRMTRMNDGAPLLNSHYSWDTRDVLGRVEKVWIEKGVGYATVRFSNRKSVDEIWQDVSEGILSKISVGYRVHAWEIVRKDGQVTTKRATDWEPHEISLVAIPADSGCSVRSWNSLNAPAARMESNVPQATDTNTAPNGTETEVRTDVQTPATETRAGNPDATDIVRYASVESNGISMTDALRFIDEGKTLTDVIRSNLAAHAAEAQETAVNTNRTSASVTNQRSPKREMELRSEMFAAETLDRTAIASLDVSEEARQFAGEGARGAAIAWLRSVGEHVNERQGDGEIIRQALLRSVGGGITTSDFLAIYNKPMQASIDQGWKETIPETNWQRLAGSLPSKDFNGRSAFSMSLFGGIGRITEDGEFPLANMSGTSYSFKLESHGIQIALTVQALINDDIGMFMEGLRDLGISWNLYNEGRFLDTLENGYVSSPEGKKKIFFAGAGGNIVNIDDLDEDNLEKLVLALRAQRQNAKLGGTLVPTAPRVLMVSRDLERKAKKAIGKGVNAAKSEDEPAYSELSLAVVDTFPAKTVYLTGGNAMKGMVKSIFLEREGDPKVDRLAMTNALRVDYQSYQHRDFVGASHLGAVKGKLPD